MEEDIEKSILEKIKKCNIYNQPEGWVIEYPQFSELADQQMHVFWPWDEPKVENDIQDLRVHMTEAEYTGTVELLRLFTLYEMHVGDDWWSQRVMKKFKRPEIQRMASMNSCVEFNSHAPFYNKINELLFLDNEEFYSSWKDVEVLKERMSFIEEHARSKNDLISAGVFSMMEGAVLYSSFAFLKHFQSQECGKDLLKNVCRGIDQSVGDENIHALGGALLFKTIYKESNFNKEEKEYISNLMRNVALKIHQHEEGVIDIMFKGGYIKGITKEQLKDFVKHRCNLCLEELGIKPVFTEELDTFIQGWFYNNINSVKLHDFFTGHGSEYNIKVDEQAFGKVWENNVRI